MTETTYILRKANIDDAGQLATCLDAAYKIYEQNISDLPPVSGGIAEDILNHLVWVATQDQNIIGGLVLIKSDDHIKLANVAVHPDHHGKGLGRKLMTLAEKTAKEFGFCEIQLNTHTKMTNNIQLYTHLGWQEIERKNNTVSMKKVL